MARTRGCIVGGGSYNWTPTLLRDIAAMPDIAGTVVLHDVDPVAVEEIGRLGRKIMDAAAADIAVEATTDLSAALRDAAFVVLTITTGGLEAMRHDLEIPRRYGVHQSVGDTVGPGGLSRALRNIPIVVEIARAMERVCPDAWLLNLSNPLTTLTRAVTKTTRIKTIGLCHELAGVRRTLLRLFDAAEDELELTVAGVNHLIWLLAVTIRGEDGLRLLRDHLAGSGEIPLAPVAEGYGASFQDRWRVKLALFDAYGYLPAAGDRHVAEFFPFFLTEQTGCGADFGVLPTSIATRYEIADHARARVRAWLDDSEPMPTGRSQEQVADVIAAVANGRSHRTVVNLPNRGQIANLPREAVVETVGVVGPTGAHGIAVGNLPPGVLSTVQPHVINQEMIVEAALAGDRRLALHALLNDPLVRDFETAPRMLDDLLRAHAAYLPRFR